MSETIVASLINELTISQIIKDFMRLHPDKSEKDILISLANTISLSDINFYFKELHDNPLSNTDAGTYRKRFVPEGALEMSLRVVAADGWSKGNVYAWYDGIKILVPLKEVRVERKDIIRYYKDKDKRYPECWETGSLIEHLPNTIRIREKYLDKALILREEYKDWTQKKIADQISKDIYGNKEKSKSILRLFTGKIPPRNS